MQKDIYLQFVNFPLNSLNVSYIVYCVHMKMRNITLYYNKNVQSGMYKNSTNIIHKITKNNLKPKKLTPQNYDF